VNGQSTSTPIALVRGKKSLAAARAKVFWFADRHWPAATDQLPLAMTSIAAQLAALGARRFRVGSRPVRQLLPHQLDAHRVTDFDGFRLEGIKPTERIAIIDLAYLSGQFSYERRNPLVDLVGSCHPWLPEFSSFSPVRPSADKFLTALLHDQPTPRKVRAAP